MVNQASLTGESIPVAKRPGTRVYAGTVVEEGECILKVEKQSGSSRYDQIVSMIEQSEKLKSTAETRASNLADRLVPYTLAGSALAFLCSRNPTRALSVLMVDFSCALKLAKMCIRDRYTGVSVLPRIGKNGHCNTRRNWMC